MNEPATSSGFAVVNGYRLHYFTTLASEQAHWVVFSNSVMTDLSIWDDQVKALRASHNILCYDQLGHGKSALPSTPLDFDTLGGSLLGLLDHLQIERCVGVGLSMGVPTVLTAYRAQPSRFTGLVVVDGQSQTAANGREFWEERMAFAQRNGMLVMAEAALGRWLQPEARADARGARLRAMIAATPLEGFMASARALQNYDLSDVLDRIDVPLLALVGALDGSMPAKMRQTFAGLTTRARFLEIEAAGHVPNLEQPSSFNRALQAFLSDIPYES